MAFIIYSCFLLDADVLSGTLTWKATPTSGRTAVTLYLTLTLLHSTHPEIAPTQVGVATIPCPGLLKYGDGITSADSAESLAILSVNADSGYIVATGAFLHAYPYSHRHGDAWLAEFEYCCRGKHLRNNGESLLALTAAVDLTHSSSPLLPTLPSITLTRSDSLQGFFYSAHHTDHHPLLYSFGSALDYHSSLSGTPQGLEISYTSGHVTWNTSHVIPGSYSVQVVVVDAFTDVRVSARTAQNNTGCCVLKI